MAGGRPTKYDPAYCDQVVEFMGEGYSLTAFAGEISVSRATINNWMDEHPEFLEATRVGQAKRTKCLEQGLLETESGARVSARTLALKNSAPDEWRDKQQVEHTGDAFKGNLDDLKRELAALVSDPAVRAVMKGEGDQ
jgi:hypothetical protein